MKINGEKMKFDDFKTIDGDVFLEYENALSKLIQKFLTQNGIRKVDALKVELKQQPFKDVVVGFMKQKQVFLLNLNEVKAPRLQETLDSALAHLFAEMDFEELKKMCQTLEKNLIKKFVTKKP